MIKMTRERGVYWTPCRTISIAPRYKDSPRGGLTAVVDDWALVDHLKGGKTTYVYTLRHARAMAAEILRYRHRVLWGGDWTRYDDGTWIRVTADGMAKVAIRTPDALGWREIAISVQTATGVRAYAWSVPQDVASAKVQAEVWGAHHWHLEIGARA